MKIQKYLLRLVALVLVGYLILIGYITYNQRSLQYFPNKEHLGLAGSNLGDTTEVFLTTRDGEQIQTWYHPPQEGMPMFIYLHGNSYSLEFRRDRFREMLDMGWGIIAPSWRGFGKSTGHPTEEGLYNDARAAVDFAKSMGYKTENTYVLGESLGSGIATKMAQESPFKGLILFTPYTSIANRAQEIYWYLPVSYILEDNFSSIDKLPSIHTPVLIIHGDKDLVIPHTHSEALLKVANEPKKMVIYSGKGHSNIDNNELIKEIKTFFNISAFEDADAQPAPSIIEEVVEPISPVEQNNNEQQADTHAPQN